MSQSHIILRINPPCLEKELRFHGKIYSLLFDISNVCLIKIETDMTFPVIEPHLVFDLLGAPDFYSRDNNSKLDSIVIVR